FLSAIAIGWTSGSAVINGSVGMTPAFIVSALFLTRSLKESRFSLIPLYACVGILVFFQFYGKAFYRDQNFSHFTTQIKSGPFHWIYTSPEKADYLANISKDIHRVENKNGKIVFFDFPAGYLISSMRPGVNSGWIRDVSRGKDFYLRYYKEHMTKDDLVFKVQWLTHEKNKAQFIRYFPDDVFSKFIDETHHRVLSREDYVVFSPNG